MHSVPNALCFLIPGQSGKLQIFELASGALLETVDAHDGALWSLCLAPDQVRSRLSPAQHPVCQSGRALFNDNKGCSILYSILRATAAEGDCDRKRRQDGQILGV